MKYHPERIKFPLAAGHFPMKLMMFSDAVQFVTVHCCLRMAHIVSLSGSRTFHYHGTINVKVKYLI